MIFYIAHCNCLDILQMFLSKIYNILSIFFLTYNCCLQCYTSDAEGMKYLIETLLANHCHLDSSIAVVQVWNGIFAERSIREICIKSYITNKSYIVRECRAKCRASILINFNFESVQSMYIACPGMPCEVSRIQECRERFARSYFRQWVRQCKRSITWEDKEEKESVGR